MTTFEKYGLKTIGIIIFIVPGLLMTQGFGALLIREGIKNIWDLISAILMMCFSIFMIFFGLKWIFPSLFNNLFKPREKKCSICNKLSADVLVVNGGKKYEKYCRNHLIEKFSQAFLLFPHKMVVIAPEQEREHCGSMYPYYPIEEMVSLYEFQKEDAVKIKEIIDNIAGKCTHCISSNARIAYFKKGLLTWDGSGPVLRKISSSPVFLCSKCALKQIELPLRNNKIPFYDNGLFIPHNQEGVFVNTYL